MKTYKAILNSNGQTTTATVLENSLGNIVWNGAVGTLAGAFKHGKTTAWVGGGSGGELATLITYELPANSEDYIVVKAHDVTAENGIVEAPQLMVRTSVKIEVEE